MDLRDRVNTQLEPALVYFRGLPSCGSDEELQSLISALISGQSVVSCRSLLFFLCQFSSHSGLSGGSHHVLKRPQNTQDDSALTISSSFEVVYVVHAVGEVGVTFNDGRFAKIVAERLPASLVRGLYLASSPFLLTLSLY